MEKVPGRKYIYCLSEARPEGRVRRAGEVGFVGGHRSLSEARPEGRVRPQPKKGTNYGL